MASVLNFLHVLPNGHIINTPIAVVAGLTYNFLPFMVLPIYASLERADPRVSRPAATSTPTGSRPSGP